MKVRIIEHLNPEFSFWKKNNQIGNIFEVVVCDVDSCYRIISGEFTGYLINFGESEIVYEEDMNKIGIKERFAELCHKQWSGWMEYLFSKSVNNDDGTVLIPSWAVERWKRQMNTDYSDLSEDEKESDRREAEKIINLM